MLTSHQTSTGQKEAILCVDSAAVLRDALFHIFSTAGHSVMHACDAHDGWTKLAAGLSQYDVLLIEHEIAVMSALQLIGRARDAHFGGRIIVYGRTIPDEDAELYRRMSVEALVATEDESATLLGVVKAFHRQD